MKKNHILGISDEGFHTIAYSEWGSLNYELPSIICVHGYTRNSRDFDPLANYLSIMGRHVFCPDVVGRGESSWFKKAHHYNFTQYVSDMNVLIARTGSTEIDWIGTSMGGIIGMMLAALPNTPIRRLVLNDVGPQIPIYALKKIAKYAGKDSEFKSMEEAKRYFQINYAEFGKLTEEQWDTFTTNTIKKIDEHHYISKLDPGIKNPKSTIQVVSEFFHHPHKALEGILYDIDLWSIWQNVKCPVLVIRGVHSDLLTPEIISRMKRAHDNVEVYEIEDAGHAPALLNQAEHERIDLWLGNDD